MELPGRPLTLESAISRRSDGELLGILVGRSGAR